MRAFVASVTLGCALAAGCSGAGDGDSVDVYAFPSRFDGADSVATNGQVLRHLLIEDLTRHLSGITERLDAGWVPASGDVEAELLFYFAFDSDSAGDVAHLEVTDPPALQATYGEVSTGKDLVGKIAGNDPIGQHRDWIQGIDGWRGESPEALVRGWIAEIDAQAVAWAAGDIPLDPSGAPVPSVFVTGDGTDLQQLLQKFLLASVAFSQGADDYLDDDTDGKGLLSDHTSPDEGGNFTALEHAWDEGWGYFGGARTYPGWSDDEIADRYLDVDGDGAIDLTTELCWGHSVNAGKRDEGSVVATDLTAEAWEGFARGRALLADTAGPLNEAELDRLRGYRDQAVAAWEGAIAATVVHYVNEVLGDMAAAGTDDYDFGAHARHWSELKGFSLAFQFNPRSAVSGAPFTRIHDLLGTAPVLGDAPEPQRVDYAAALVEVRDVVGGAFAFDASNLGDGNGQGGW